MMQAETLQQQMEIFLEMTQEHVMSGEVEGEDQVVSDAEIDKMLDEEVLHEEGGSVDKDIEKGLKDIQEELDRERWRVTALPAPRRSEPFRGMPRGWRRVTPLGAVVAYGGHPAS